MERVLLNILLVSSYLVCDTTESYSHPKIRIRKTSPGNRYSRSATDSVSCSLPPPENGRWLLPNGQRKEGEAVNENDIIQIECNKGYKLSSVLNHYLRCNSNWTVSNLPKCKKMCPELNLGEGFDVSTLSFQCPFGFEIPDGVKSTIECRNGSWETPTPECQLIQDPADTKKPEEDKKVVCYYDSTRYFTGAKPIELNSSLCTHLIYHYAGLSLGGDIVNLDSSSDIDGNESLYKIVKSMKNTNNNLKVLLSISGLGVNAGDEFPTVAADPVKMSRFVASVVSFLEMYEFDGIDIYWHFPSIEHKEDYAVLLEELNKALSPRDKILTATVYLAPTFLGYNISAMNVNLAWINIKCYEHYNEFSRYTGQNSALYPSSVQSSYEADNLNVQACGNNWESHGIKKNKIVMGVTFFGRYYTLLDPTRHGVRAPVTGSTNKNYTGLVSYSEICQKYDKWRRVWDDEQKNPYKYYENKWVGYDDPDSVKMKAAYIKKMRYAGIAVFSIDADDIEGSCGPKQILLKQVNDGLND